MRYTEMVHLVSGSRLVFLGREAVIGTVAPPANHRRTREGTPRTSLRLCGDGASASGPVPFFHGNRTKYVYDKAHNRKFEKRVHDAKGDAYRYDGIYELTGAKYGVPIADLDPTKVYTDYLTFDREQTWTYDGVGNWEAFVEAVTGGSTDTYEYNRAPGGGAYSPDSVNRMYRIRKNGTDTDRTHDANGNLTDDGTYTYVYNYNNEQIEVRRKSDGALVESANYNCFGLRITRQASPPVYFYLDGPRVVEERDSADAVAATNVYGAWIDEVLTMDRGGATYFYSQQALYSVAYISDASGNNFEKVQYDAFGKPSFFHWIPFPAGGGTWTAVTQSLIGNPFAFTGREWSVATASYYYRARYLDPLHGRFKVRDPLPCDRCQNQYAGFGNNPAKYADPSGLVPFLVSAAAFISTGPTEPPAGSWSSGNTQGDAWFYGDNRTAGQKGRARVWTEILVEVDGRHRGDPLIWEKSGLTRTMVIWNYKTKENMEVHSGFGTGEVTQRATRTGLCSVLVEIDVAARPWWGAALFAPDIDYHYKVELNQMPNVVQFSLSGHHDGYPDYEVLMQHTLVDSYNPKAAGTGQWSLFGSGDVSVYKAGALPPGESCADPTIAKEPTVYNPADLPTRCYKHLDTTEAERQEGGGAPLEPSDNK